MLAEVQETPELVRAALGVDQNRYAELGAKLRDLNPSFVATVARGSSDHTANYASYLISQATGKLVASVAPSLVTTLKSSLEAPFALAISQGGSSPDLIQTLQNIRARGAFTLAIVNQAESALGRAAEVEISPRAGNEKSIAATKSVICTMTSVARLVAEWAQDESLQKGLVQLPESLRSACEAGVVASDRLLDGFTHVYVLSRGLGLSAALETALKLKETCGLHAEAFSSAEVRHGPREIVDGKFLVLALALPGPSEQDIVASARELEAQGARVVFVGPRDISGSLALPAMADFRLAPIAALELVYAWLARSSKALGRDPDHPKTLLNKIIKTT